MKRRALCGLLAGLIFLSSTPLAVFADENTQVEDRNTGQSSNGDDNQNIDTSQNNSSDTSDIAQNNTVITNTRDNAVPVDIVKISTKIQGDIDVNRYEVVNNMASCDYHPENVKLDKSDADIYETCGMEGNKNDYFDTKNYKLNYLIENGVYSRYGHLVLQNKHWSFYEGNTPILAKKSDLLMALIKSYDGISPRKISLHCNYDRKAIKSKDYEYKSEIKQDDILSDITVKFKYLNIVYFSPNNKTEYLDKAKKLALVDESEIDNYALKQQIQISDNTLNEEDIDVLTSEYMDYYQAIQLVAKAVRKKESAISDKQKNTIEYIYSDYMNKNIPSYIRDDVALLMAKGILSPKEDLSNREFTFNDFINLMYLVKNKDQRYKIDDLTGDDKTLMNRGYKKSTIELIENDSSEEIFGEPKDIKVISDVTEQKDFEVFTIRNFFNQKAMKYVKDNKLSLDNYAKTFYLTLQSCFSQSMCGIYGTDYVSRLVNGTDLQIKVRSDIFKNIKNIADAQGETIEINSPNAKDYPRNGKGIKTSGTYSIEEKGEDSFLTQLTEERANNLQATTSSNLKSVDFTINLMVPKKGADLSYFNYVDKNHVYTLDNAIKNSKIKVTDSKKSNVGNTTVFTLKINVTSKSADPRVLADYIQTKIVINKNKWNGYSAVDAFINSNGTTLVSRDYLNYFGGLDVVADKVLRNRVTGAYIILIDGTDKTSRAPLNTVISGSVVKRYNSAHDFTFCKLNGNMYYNLDAIKQIMPHDVFKSTIKKDYVYVKTKKNITSICINEGKKEYNVQKDYFIVNNKKSYLNMDNLNYANDFMIIDLGSYYRGKMNHPKDGLEAKAIVQWTWRAPGTVFKGLSRKFRTDYSDKLFSEPSDATLKRYWTCNIDMTNKLINSAVGTTNFAYATSGYIVPQITVLASPWNSKTTTEDKAKIDSIWRDIFKGFQMNGRDFTSFNTVQKFFNEYGAEDTQFYTYLTPSSRNKDLSNFNNKYVIDKKGSVFIALNKVIETTNTKYTLSNNSKIYINPNQKSSRAVPLKTGETYAYTDPRESSCYVYNNHTNDGYSFIKKYGSSSDLKLNGLDKKGLNTDSSKKIVFNAIRDKLKSYNSGGDDFYADYGKVPKDYDDLKNVLPTDGDVVFSIVPSEQRKSYRNIVRWTTSNIKNKDVSYVSAYPSSFLVKKAGEKAPVINLKEGSVIADSGDAKYEVANSRLRLCPELKVKMYSDLTCTPSIGQIPTKNGVIRYKGIIRKYSVTDVYEDMTFNYPNFNFSQQWASQLLNKSIKLKDLSVGSQVTFNGNTKYEILEKKGSNVKLQGLNLKDLTSLGFLVNGKSKGLLTFVDKNDNKVVSGDLYCNPIVRDNSTVYEVSAYQDSLTGLNSGLPFDMDIDSKDNNDFLYDYIKEDIESPQTLDEDIRAQLKKLAAESKAAKKSLLCVIIIRLTCLLLVFMWLSYLVNNLNICRRPFATIRRETNIDLIRILTLGQYELDEQMNFARLTVTSVILIFIQIVAIKVLT